MEEKKKFIKLILSTFFIVLAIIAICIMGVIINNNSNKNITNKEVKMQDLQADELESFNKLFNEDQENNGIIRCEFSNADEIDLNNAIREIGTSVNKEEEEYFKQKYSKNPLIDFEISTFKYSEDNIIKFYKEKTGKDITSEELKNRISNNYYIYVEQYKAYYASHGDTAYQGVKCISGKKSSDGTYKITFKEGLGSNEGKLIMSKPYNAENYNANDSSSLIYETVDQMQVTLKKQGDNYIFISNIKQ